MRHDPTATCDVCEQPIDLSRPFPTINVPVPRDIREEVIEEMVKRAPIPDGILRGMIAPYVPDRYTLDICAACLTKALPQISALVALRIRLRIEATREEQLSVQRMSGDN